MALQARICGTTKGTEKAHSRMAWLPRLTRAQMRIVQLAVSFGLLFILFHAVDGAEAMRILRRADLGLLALAWLIMGLQTVLSAVRWKLIAFKLGQRFTWKTAVSEYYLSQFINQSLPGGMIGDAGRAYRARHHAGLVKAGQAVFFERAAQQAGIFFFFLAAFIITTILPGGLSWPLWLNSIVTPAVLISLGLPVVFWLGWQLPGPQKRALDNMWQAVIASMLKGKALPVQVVLSLLTALCNIGAFYLCALATGTDLPMAATFGLVPLILFMMLVPVTVSGWGVREGVAAALFPITGATASAGLAASIAFGLVFLAAVLPGVIAILKRKH